MKQSQRVSLRAQVRDMLGTWRYYKPISELKHHVAMLGTLRFMVEDFKEYISGVLRNKLWHTWYI
jgi:hypothetical protein